MAYPVVPEYITVHLGAPDAPLAVIGDDVVITKEGAQ